MKNVTEDEKDFLRFPYEGYFDSEEYKNRKSDSMDITDERNEYYKNQYKKFFPDEWSHVHLGVQYFPLIPLPDSMKKEVPSGFSPSGTFSCL